MYAADYAMPFLLRRKGRVNNMTNYFPRELVNLETEDKWEDAVALLYNRWRSEPDNEERLIAAGLEIWFVLAYTDGGCYPGMELLDEDVLSTQLGELMQYGVNHFDQSVSFNVYFGYMIALLPYLFMEIGDSTDTWVEEGIRRICFAHQLCPDDLFISAVYHGVMGPSDGFLQARHMLLEAVGSDLTGWSAVERQLFRILCSEDMP